MSWKPSDGITNADTLLYQLSQGTLHKWADSPYIEEAWRVSNIHQKYTTVEAIAQNAQEAAENYKKMQEIASKEAGRRLHAVRAFEAAQKKPNVNVTTDKGGWSLRNVLLVGIAILMVIGLIA